MSKLKTQVGLRFEVRAKALGSDGWEYDLGELDGSFRSWRRIVRWNVHYRHWDAVRLNVRDLFTKVIWRKLWRLSA